MNKAQILNHINVYIDVAEHDIKSRHETIEIIKNEMNHQSLDGQLYLLKNAIQHKLEEVELLENLILKLNDYKLNLPNFEETDFETRFMDIIIEYQRN